MTEDPEIMAFWKELIEKGHPDKEEGWVELTDIASLTDILTTIAFNGSVHHTAVNFGEGSALPCPALYCKTSEDVQAQSLFKIGSTMMCHGVLRFTRVSELSHKNTS